MLARKVGDIMEHLQKRIVGQPEVMAEIKSVLVRIAAGITNPKLPLAVLYFAGPSGVGKSETAVALTEAICGNSEMLCRVPCNQLQERYSIASIFGAPPGYVGWQEKATLINEDKICGSVGRPGIWVFEEIEKANPAIWDALLDAIDHGRILMNGATEEFPLSNTIIIMTSNIGSRKFQNEVSGRQIGFKSKCGNAAPALTDRNRAKTIIKEQMAKLYAPEFIGRIDEVITFNWLTEKDAKKIVWNLAVDFAGRLRERYAGLRLEPEVFELVAKGGFQESYGVRAIRQEFKKQVEMAVAEKMLEVDARGVYFTVRCKGNGTYAETEVSEKLAEMAYLAERQQAQKAAAAGQPVAAEQKKIASCQNSDCSLENRALRIGRREINLRLAKKDIAVFELWKNVFNRDIVALLFVDMSEEEIVRILKLISNVVRHASVRYEEIKNLPELAKTQILLEARSGISGDNKQRGIFTAKTIKILQEHKKPSK